jgi:hypothetical protein
MDEKLNISINNYLNPKGFLGYLGFLFFLFHMFLVGVSILAITY